jgi:hypothetical protein
VFHTTIIRSWPALLLIAGFVSYLPMPHWYLRAHMESLSFTALRRRLVPHACLLDNVLVQRSNNLFERSRGTYWWLHPNLRSPKVYLSETLVIGR